MTDWLDELAKKAKERYQDQRQSDERFNTEQKLKVALGEKFWRDLIATLDSQSREFNAHFGASVVSMVRQGSHSSQVLAQFTKEARKAASVSFAQDRHAIEWGSGQGQPIGAYLLKLIGDTHAVAEGGGKNLTPEGLAQEIVTYVVSPS
jgi:hypothetical protein